MWTSNDSFLESALSFFSGFQGFSSGHQDKAPFYTFHLFQRKCLDQSRPEWRGGRERCGEKIGGPSTRLVNHLFCFHFYFPLRSWIFESKPPEFVVGEFLSRVQPNIPLLGKKQELKKKVDCFEDLPEDAPKQLLPFQP